MQPIERYALVTLLFLVVLVMVVALWDDGSDSNLSPENQEIARVEEPLSPTTGAARRPAGDPALRSDRPPVSGTNDLEARATRVRTRRGAEAQHRVKPGGEPSEPVAQPPVAQSAAELRGTLSPARGNEVAMLDTKVIEDRPGSAAPFAGGSFGPSRRRTNEPAGGGALEPAVRPKSSGSTTGPNRPSPAVDRPAKTEIVAKPAGNDPASALRDYVIRSGDSFERIANREVGDAGAAAAIASLNGLSLEDTIYEGRTLKLPPRSDVANRDGAVAQSPTAAPGGGRTVYTFKRGDMLSVVLVDKFGTYKRSIALVKELNPGMNPDRIVEGTRIVLPRADEIPGGVTVAKSTAAPSVFSAPPTRRAANTKNEFVVR